MALILSGLVFLLSVFKYEKCWNKQQCWDDNEAVVYSKWTAQ
ncbi:MAG: hypothetical protein ACI8WB_005764 [Phenylobacterium sp.]|jgi:hypothetical protein